MKTPNVCLTYQIILKSNSKLLKICYFVFHKSSKFSASLKVYPGSHNRFGRLKWEE